MRTLNLAGRLHLRTLEGPVDVERLSSGRFGPDPQDVYSRWDEFIEWAGPHACLGADAPVLVDSGTLGSPAPRPRQIFAVGFNYLDHVSESEVAVPEEPAIFTKFESSLTGPDGLLVLPSDHVDWEVELVVVVGRRAVSVDPDRAWDHVAGLAVGQDYSERRVQLAGPHPQFSLGKSFPGFGPIGPVLVTPDEFEHPDDLAIECSIDGETVQKARTSAMIFKVPDLISRISAVLPILPGDVIFTGTPSGVGAARTPARFLRPGEKVVSRVEGIGSITQRCVAPIGRGTLSHSVTHTSFADDGGD